jgi:MFS family permease
MEKRERLWNSNYWKVMTANFTMSFAFYLLTPLLPLYLSETFGSTKDMIGLVLSGYTLTALLIRPFSGFIVDSFPRKRVLMVCLLPLFIRSTKVQNNYQLSIVNDQFFLPFVTSQPFYHTFQARSSLNCAEYPRYLEGR